MFLTTYHIKVFYHYSRKCMWGSVWCENFDVNRAPKRWAPLWLTLTQFFAPHHFCILFHCNFIPSIHHFFLSWHLTACNILHHIIAAQPFIASTLVPVPNKKLWFLTCRWAAGFSPLFLSQYFTWAGIRCQVPVGWHSQGKCGLHGLKLKNSCLMPAGKLAPALVLPSLYLVGQIPYSPFSLALQLCFISIPTFLLEPLTSASGSSSPQMSARLAICSFLYFSLSLTHTLSFQCSFCPAYFVCFFLSFFNHVKCFLVIFMPGADRLNKKEFRIICGT